MTDWQRKRDEAADFYVDETLCGEEVDEQQCWDGFKAGADWARAELQAEIVRLVSEKAALAGKHMRDLPEFLEMKVRAESAIGHLRSSIKNHLELCDSHGGPGSSLEALEHALAASAGYDTESK